MAPSPNITGPAPGLPPKPPVTVMSPSMTSAMLRAKGERVSPLCQRASCVESSPRARRYSFAPSSPAQEEPSRQRDRFQWDWSVGGQPEPRLLQHEEA